MTGGIMTREHKLKILEAYDALGAIRYAPDRKPGWVPHGGKSAGGAFHCGECDRSESTSEPHKPDCARNNAMTALMKIVPYYNDREKWLAE
jgi:hypothetical protein